MTSAKQKESARARQTGDNNRFSQVQETHNRCVRFEFNLEGADVDQLITIGTVHVHVRLDMRGES